LAGALERACQTFDNRVVWDQLIRTGMSQDWSWNHSAHEYDRLYKHTLARATNPTC
jgi:starch synthase